jgi:hypothetical protein
MSLKLVAAAGLVFAGLLWGRVFGLVPVRVDLADPMGDYQAIQVQIESLERLPADSSSIRTIDILDTLACGGK